MQVSSGRECCTLVTPGICRAACLHLLVKVLFFLGEVLLGLGGVIALHHAVIVTSA
jgi:hypothetical protein